MRIFKTAFYSILPILICGSFAFGQLQTSFVSPRSTDPEISTNLSNHFFAIDSSVPQKNQLVVFFPGTGGTPLFTREIIRNAATLGFHSIGLTYPNDDAVNSLCGGLRTDLDCYGNVRLEIIDGTDRSALVTVTRANSIENRIIKLLIFLNNTRPGEGWNQFLNNSTSINWTNIIVAGHSQGGGHAGIIGRYHNVKRVLMFAAMDYNGLLQMPANWIARPETTPNASPPDRFRAFSHTQDESVGFMNLSSKVWPAYGMSPFGSITNVDSTMPPFGESHSLTSTRQCDNFHGCIAVDIRLVYKNGVPVYKPVWDYLLSNTDSSATISSLDFTRFGAVVPRPHVGTVTKRHRLLIRGTGFDGVSRVFINGREARIISFTAETIDALIPSGKFGAIGLSIIKVQAGNGSQSNAIRY